MKDLIEQNKFILMEGAVVETLRRSPDIELHPSLVNTPLIYDEFARKTMTKIYSNYINIAWQKDLPFLMVTPTWRTNKERMEASGVKVSLIADAITFMKEIRSSFKPYDNKIKIGGLIGCKNDCYLPDQGLNKDESEKFHAWQIDQLVMNDVDFLIAETLPNVEEALGIARAMEKTNVPYIISFVISSSGKILDNTDLLSAISYIDSNVTKQPLGYTVNCAYPSFLNAEKQPQKLFNRLIGYMANASSLDHCDLENSDELHQNEIEDWGNLMLDLHEQFGIKILGGCCGTNEDYLQYLVDRITKQEVNKN